MVSYCKGVIYMSVIKTQFTLRLDPVIHAKIKKIAAEQSRSMTNMIEYLIKNEISKYEKENGTIDINEDDIYIE